MICLNCLCLATKNVDLWRHLCANLLYFGVRIRCRCEESSRSPSQLVIVLNEHFVIVNVIEDWGMFGPRNCSRICKFTLRYRGDSILLPVTINVFYCNFSYKSKSLRKLCLLYNLLSYNRR